MKALLFDFKVLSFSYVLIHPYLSKKDEEGIN
jgi:hypothetical protein